jgi:hypothetical protein
MKLKLAIATVVVVVAAVLIVVLTGGSSSMTGPEEVPGAPAIEVVAPRNGSIQMGQAVVVKVRVSNFQLAPARFNKAPELRQGNLRFSLNRLPDCVDPAKLAESLASPLSNGRLVGRSYDYPKWTGPNGQLAAQIGTLGLSSPATKPEIYYHRLPYGLYRLGISLVQNNGAPTPYHAISYFEIQPNPHLPPPAPPDCAGKVSRADAFEQVQ